VKDRELFHPEAADISLDAILGALSDPIRRDVLRRIASEGALYCGDLSYDVVKSTMSHHFRVLRESGLMHTEREGKHRRITRRDDAIEQRFPGLLAAVGLVPPWLAGLGFTRQMIHANGFGATAALLARPEHVRTAVLVGAIVGPQSILWEEIFSSEQLDELAQHGLTRLVDDNPNSREWNVLSKETLADFSMQDPQRTLADLPWPVLMVHGVLSNELPDTAEATAEGFPLLPDSSQMVHVHAESLEQAQEEVARLSVEWAQRRLR